MSDITNRIDLILSSKHLRRADLCKATDIPDATIRNWIRGSEPSADYLHRVASFLGVTMEWLISGKDYPSESDFILSEEERDIIKTYRCLDSRDKNAVATLNRALEEQYTDRLSPLQSVAKKI